MEITAENRNGFTDKMRIKYRMRDIVQPYSRWSHRVKYLNI